MHTTVNRVIRAVALGVTIVIVGAGAAPALADSTYPTPGGSTFTAGADGWSDAGQSCSTLLGVLPNLLCTVDSGHSETAGVPPGSLRQEFTPAVGALGPVLTTGTVSQRSPSFTVDGFPTVTGGTLTYDRRFTNEALINIGPGVTSTVSLVDETVPSTFAAPESLDTVRTFQSRTVIIPATALVAGHTYHLVLRTDFSPTLQALLGRNSVNYDNVRLSVADGSVAPTATTLPATNVSASGATLNGSLTTGGPPVVSYFEYGPTTAYGQRTPDRPATTNGPVAGEPIGGLAPLTTYNFRLVVKPREGALVTGANATFTTLSSVGPTGAAGATGSAGASGPTGAVGAGGPTGAAGATGPAGTKGTTGAPGATGPTGASSTGGGRTIIIQNGSNKGLIKIRSTNVTVVTAGRLRGQLRLPIFCRSATGRACAGTVKVRTLAKINPATRPPNRAKRRVTLTTFEYQLAQGRSGFAFGTLRDDKLDLLKRTGPIAVSISIQVTDSRGNRQIVVANGRVIPRRTA